MKESRILRAAIVLLTMVGLCGQAQAQSCVDPPGGVVGWWPGDGTGADIESGHDAKLRNGATFAPGFVGDAFSVNGFDAGQDDVVILSHLMVDGLADLTVELWVNTTDSAGGMVSGANGKTNGSNELLLYVQNASSLTPWVKQGNAGALPAVLSDGSWHHVAFTRTAATGALYVDGVLVAMMSYLGGPLEIGPHGLQLGQEQDCLAGCFDPDQALDGLFDEVTFYDRALTEAEILTVFNAGTAGKCKPAPVDGTVPVVIGDDVVTVEELDALRFEIDELNDRLTAQEQEMADMAAKGDESEVDGEESWKHRDGHHHDKRHSHWKKMIKKFNRR